MCCGGRGRALVSPELGREEGNGQNIITTGANTEMWKYTPASAMDTKCGFNASLIPNA